MNSLSYQKIEDIIQLLNYYSQTDLIQYNTLIGRLKYRHGNKDLLWQGFLYHDNINNFFNSLICVTYLTNMVKPIDQLLKYTYFQNFAYNNEARQERGGTKFQCAKLTKNTYWAPKEAQTGYF